MNTIAAMFIANQFPREDIMSMIAVALLCTVIPFGFLGYYRAKTNAKTASFFIGMGFYFLFALVAEGLFNTIVLRPLSGVLNRSTHPYYYALYGAVVAGIFEETGKYIGLKKCMANRPGKENAFLFGVGHGSFEMIAYGSSLFMGNIVIAFMVNSFGIDGYFEKLGITEHIEEQTQAFHALIASSSPLENAAAGIERVLALVFQASLTIFIYLAINHKELKSLFPIAIVLHIIGYLPTYLIQVGMFASFDRWKLLMLPLCLTGVIVVFTASYAYRMFHQVSDSEKNVTG